MATVIDTGYRPRPLQDQIHRSLKRFNVLVCHRRFGKTVLCINDLIDQCLRCKLERPRYAYIAPLYRQAKQTAWDYLKHYTQGIAEPSESELRVEMPNGGRIQLYGADNPDALRGIYLDGVVMDEYAQMSGRVWSEVIRPALSDRAGYAMFIGTPKGRNEFCELYEEAFSGNAGPDWFGALYKASETQVLPQIELDAALRDMGEDDYAQEFECSFDAAIRGAYYGKLISQAEADGRVGAVPYQPELRVHTAWDLGIGDSTAIWFFQQSGREIHWIDYYETSGEGLNHYVKHLDAKPYLYGQHYFPHDVVAKELGTGKSRVDVLASLGITARVVALANVDDGINAARIILPRSWFDRQRCAEGIEAMRQYRRQWDDVRGIFCARPLHDRYSHGADAFRYAAMGLDEADRTPARAIREIPAGNEAWMT